MIKQDAVSNTGQTPAWKEVAFLRKVEPVITFIEEWLNLIAVGIIMFLMFFSVSEIIGRYLFNAPIPGHVEIVELIMAGVVYLGIAHTEKEGGHVRMELFLTKVLKNRGYHVAEMITITLSFCVYLMILIFSFKSTVNAFQVGDTTGYIYWQTWPSKLAIPIGSLFLCIRFILEFIQHALQVKAGTEMRNLN
jgi:C4-dicarboxylate transporter, DctQ subunit